MTGIMAAMYAGAEREPAQPQKIPSAIPRRPLGRTGVEVSALGLGGFHIGTQSERESIRLIRTAIDAGITFLDNCWDYNGGRSETRMGKALAGGYRNRVFLMTKIDGRTAPAAREQLEQSLQRLGTDMIDLVQIHEVIRRTDPDRCFARGGAMEALVEARDAGKLRFIGFTGHKDPDIHLAMLEAAQRHGFVFDTVQLPLNVMDAHYRSFEKKVVPLLVKNDIGVLGMKPLGGGHILRSGVATAAECLRYALSLPASVVICGMDNFRVLQKNIETARQFQPMSREERAALLVRTEQPARLGKYERFKTSGEFDATNTHPHWLEEARL